MNALPPESFADYRASVTSAVGVSLGDGVAVGETVSVGDTAVSVGVADGSDEAAAVAVGSSVGESVVSMRLVGVSVAITEGVVVGVAVDGEGNDQSLSTARARADSSDNPPR